jgi:tRNA G18 (ribose-2'-O)-methylase SpoU
MNNFGDCVYGTAKMQIVRISSLDDPRLEPYRQLKDTNRTRWAGLFICEGEKLVRRLLASEFSVESVLLSNRFEQQFETIPLSNVPVWILPDELIEPLVGFNFHRGILACGRRRANPTLEELAPPGRRLTLAICPEVQDPENLGAILRISSAFGVDGVLVGRGSADPFSRRVLRVSMGASLRVPIREATDIAADLRQLRDSLAVELAATVLDSSAEPLANATRPDRFALLFGSEGHGLDPSIVALCDRRITIPMNPGADSLNVAVAAGIFLHHFCGAARP